MDNTQFVQSVSWIRVLENQLLNGNELERMILAKDAKDAYKILNETDYSSHIGDIEDVSSFEEVINHGLADTKELINRIAPNKWIFNILWYRYDFHNMKVLLKAKHSEKSFEDIENLIFNFGAVPSLALKKYIFDGEEPSFGLGEEDEKYLKESIKLAEGDYLKSNDPQMIDIVLDKRFCKIINAIAEQSGNEFLIKFTKKYIDLKNIELFIRLKIQGREEALLEKGFINRGYIDKYRFSDSFRKDVNEFAEALKHTDYGSIISGAVKGYNDDKSFVKLDKLSYDHLTNYIQQAKRMAMGPEPVFAYFWAKKNNALIIRSIMVGKLNEIEAEHIRKMVRDLY
ncbi:V-type ATPase subunit [bacterium]|nr:V-type ATPase subunit [bacterium]